uniref:Uncharacterized protein n=1 Tax=Paenarthrobacter nicotinovorans TaxID=29320 RepID=Q8GAF3_PAENI|nr:hypothetical protein [Paenarthrobacter nicotinovorans]
MSPNTLDRTTTKHRMALHGVARPSAHKDNPPYSLSFYGRDESPRTPRISRQHAAGSCISPSRALPAFSLARRHAALPACKPAFCQYVSGTSGGSPFPRFSRSWSTPRNAAI